jgi:acetyl-CoA carboxylase beta subunit
VTCFSYTSYPPSSDSFIFAPATSSAIRTTLAAHPNLPALLTSIDKLRGPDREHALQRALGVTAPEIAVATHAGGAELSEDVLALRALAEAVEAAVRSKKEGALGLDWGE